MSDREAHSDESTLVACGQLHYGSTQRGVSIVGSSCAEAFQQAPPNARLPVLLHEERTVVVQGLPIPARRVAVVGRGGW